MLTLDSKKNVFLVLIIVVICVGFYCLRQTFLSHHKGVQDDEYSKFLSSFEAKYSKYQHIQVADNLPNVNSKYFKSLSEVDQLSEFLKYKLSIVKSKEKQLKPVCHKPEVIANSCNADDCLRMSLATSLKQRVSELVTPSKLRVSSSLQRVLDDMVEDVPKGVEFTILTAASSNHFLEAQALIHNVHRNIFPHFNNFTFVFYNIGLTPKEREQVVRFCKCQVIDFPFERFPSFVRKSTCYSWKPIIINAHIKLADIVLWADSSIRFDSDPSTLSQLFKRVKTRGIQFGSSSVPSPFRTYKTMYHYFGDEPCVYLNMYQVQATISLFANDLFTKKAVLDPWVACAVTEKCMCPVSKPTKTCADSDRMVELWESGQGPIVYGLCHRYDQSAISLILHKLYQGFFHWVTFHVSSYLQIKRKDQLAYFDDLINQ